MKIVHLTLDDNLWKQVRSEAAKRDMSVSKLMCEALASLVRGADNRQMESKQRDRLVDLLEQCQIDLTGKPTREATAGNPAA